MSAAMHSIQYEPTEWVVQDSGSAADPAVDTRLDVTITGPGGEWNVPAFWSGDSEWRVRFAAPGPGTYHWESCWRRDGRAPSVEQSGTLEVDRYEGNNPLYRHGPLEIGPERRHLRHRDGTPFCWLGDTWWMGLTKRLSWPEGFEELAADRQRKGFTLVQIVAGVQPDMEYGDPRGENEAGLPYDRELSRPNPGWWDAADLKVRSLIRHGLVPCIVGSWGYHATVFGTEKLQRHWRNLIARWGAYPVVWCLAGEAIMPYYLSTTRDTDASAQRTRWTEIATYVRSNDPMRRPLTIHPTVAGRDQVDDDSVLDFDMLQTGHQGGTAVGNTVRLVAESRARIPTMPVVVGEVIYEGILHDTDAEKQRLVWWASMLGGAAGFTYGANGIWQVNTPEEPFGPSPHGATWGNTPWQEAARLPGATQLGRCARFLQRFDWQSMEPHPEWVTPAAAADDPYSHYAAGVPGEFRLIYFYALVLPWGDNRFHIADLKSEGTEGGSWRARWFDPREGHETDLGMVTPDASGLWEVPVAPEMKDYLLVMERDTQQTGHDS